MCLTCIHRQLYKFRKKLIFMKNVNRILKIQTSKKRKQKTIKTKLLIGMVALAAGISILSGGISSIILYNNADSSMKSSMSASAKAYSHTVQNALNAYRLGIETVAKNTEITDERIDLSVRQAKMAEFAKQYGFETISISDENGKTSDGTDISECDFYKNAEDGVTYVSSTLISKTDSKVTVYVATKFNNGTSYSGIVYGALSSDQISGLIDDVSIGKSGYGYIVDKTGKIIADKSRANVNNMVNYMDKSKKDSSLSDVAGLTKLMTAGKTGGQICNMNGSSKYISYLPISGSDGWSIAVVANVSEMMGSMTVSLAITGVLIIIFIILSCVISSKIADPIVNPIVGLVRRIESLAEGDLHTEVPFIQTNDEVQALSEAFGSTVYSLNNYIGEISNVLGSMSKGDFTVEITQDYKGDFVAIKTALNEIVASLHGMFSDINQSADLVACGAGQMADSAQALSQGAAEQASTIEQLSASIEEIANHVKQSSANASSADQLAAEAAKEIDNGNEHMEQMIAAMEEISKSSNEIGEIIKTIQNIAFQTNILALNAAVEAARAGQAGKGFAVVADEVRNLAGRSAEAAENTTALIENSIHAVEKGRKIADETAKALHAIVLGTQQTTELIRQISNSADEQASSINQVTAGVEQISSVVQTNSATAEQNAATSEELSEQAQLLKENLARIELEKSEKHMQAETDRGLNELVTVN